MLSQVGDAPLLIGKSLGTLAAALAAEPYLPAVWLTPLLTVPWAVAVLEHAGSPFLLVGGTADSAWNSAIARRLTPHVLEIDNTDHGMFFLPDRTGCVVLAEQDAVAGAMAFAVAAG